MKTTLTATEISFLSSIAHGEGRMPIAEKRQALELLNDFGWPERHPDAAVRFLAKQALRRWRTVSLSDGSLMMVFE